jgi:PilZ domain-containing protein
MNGPFIERRQSPRIPLDGVVQCRLDLRTRVRMLDISLSGALLAAELALPAGAAADLRTGLGVTAFRAEVEVQRTVGLTAGALVNGIGAMFTTMDDRSRRGLEDFLRKASQ